MSENPMQRTSSEYTKRRQHPSFAQREFRRSARPKELSPSPHRGPPSFYPSFQALHPCPEAFDDITYVAYFVEFRLEVIDLAQDVAEAGDFGVGGSNRGLSARRLVDGGALSLRRKLARCEQAVTGHGVTGRAARRSWGEYRRTRLRLSFRNRAVKTYVIDPALDRPHQPLKVIAQHRQTPRVQQQPPTSSLPRACRTRCARGGSRTAGVSAAARGSGAVGIMRRGAGATGRQSDLLVLAKNVELRLGETELGIRYRRRKAGWHRRGSLHVALLL